MKNRITELFQITYPIVQAGMVWCSGWRLASAVSNAGALGIIGAGSMTPELLREHIRKCKAASNRPFGVNIPLMYAQIEETLAVVMEEGVGIVFTSAGSPASYTARLQASGSKVVHVVSSLKFGLKAQDAGVDAVVGEGFEAGGHNGREETTTLCLIPELCAGLSIPVIAAGGIASGKGMLAAFCLGADGVQLGTRFAASLESSAHENFKQRIVGLGEGETQLSLKKLAPVRLVKNAFFEAVSQAEARGAEFEELKELLGKGRARLGMFEGKLDEGELEIGQAASQLSSIEPAGAIVETLWQEFLQARQDMIGWDF